MKHKSTYKLSFKGSYNVDEKNVNNNIWTFNSYISKNKKGNNVISATFNYVNDGKEQYLKENYHLAIFRHGHKVGEMLWDGLYKDSGTSGVASGLQHFTVSAAKGICSNISLVVMDFSQKVRKIYFYKKRH
jgi:hypothetical protein